MKILSAFWNPVQPKDVSVMAIVAPFLRKTSLTVVYSQAHEKERKKQRKEGKELQKINTQRQPSVSIPSLNTHRFAFYITT